MKTSYSTWQATKQWLYTWCVETDRYVVVVLCSLWNGVGYHWVQMSWRRPAMTAALTPPEMGSVTSHAMMMFLKSFQSTLSLARTRPTDTMEPTLQCVVEMGIPAFDATSTVRAAPISIQNPLRAEHEQLLTTGIDEAPGKHVKKERKKEVKKIYNKIKK